MRIQVIAISAIAAITVNYITTPARANTYLPETTEPASSVEMVPVTPEPTAIEVMPVTPEPAAIEVVPLPIETAQPAAIEVAPVTIENQSPAAISPPENITPPQPTFRNTQPATPQTNSDLVVMATDVKVVGVGEQLQQIVRNVIQTRAGGDTSQTQLKKDVESILATGLFADAQVSSQTNKTGLEVTYKVSPVVIQSLQLQGAQILPLSVANEIFREQIGRPINPELLNQAGDQINKWYSDNGYKLAQVATMQPAENGMLIVEVAEGNVSKVNIQFISRDGEVIDQDGMVVRGRTDEAFIRDELKLKPGQVFSEKTAQEDLLRLYRTGLFQNAYISLNGDARNVEVTYNLAEAPSRSVNMGAGFSANTGIVGTLNYQDFNVGGNNQKLGFNFQGNTRDIQFDSKYTNPYRSSQPNRWGYSINAFRNRVLSLTFNEDITLQNGDSPREGQFGGGVNFSRQTGEWQTTLGAEYKRTSIRDTEGRVANTDELGNSLTFSDAGVDDLTTLTASLTRDQRNNPFNPTSGSVVSFSTEQSIPIGLGGITMNRLEANYSQYTSLNLVGSDKNPDVLAVNVKGGTVIGDLPPYEAFNLGGPNSVRGYSNGAVGTGRSYVLASAEYRFPLFQPVGGVLFADFASDLGSGDTVPGEPGVVREKPGIGFSYGAGLRFNSPIGIIRADYGFTDQGDGRLQFGVGQKF
jgi:outer membrane protein insertion porin family